LDNLTLIEIEKLLQSNRKSLTDFPCIPFPNNYVTAELGNRLIYDELDYDVNQQKQEFENLFQSLTGIIIFPNDCYIHFSSITVHNRYVFYHFDSTYLQF
jgi:hypothetical protein